MAAAAAARVFRGSRFLMSPAAPAAGGKKSAAAAAVTKEDAMEAKAVRGIQRPRPVSEALRSFIGGAPEVARTEAMKLIWAHIKASGLQNPANRREIILDPKLKSLFGEKDKIGMMEISKLLSPHFIKN